ncbi:beta-class carbonic anhydrase [Acidipropionibacterium timonense]|uniref:beta-class carbonic anhydrase n=1 Tax=Acidipropionibacterium timonense TaxID=2161818 RepID=UPI001030FBC0|nr:carbonic anhydrase [Acidipropionibacterium timonense]
MAFDDLLAGNARYAQSFSTPEMPGRAAKGVGVVCCMDCRLDPLAMLGLELGDAKVLRTPGGRVTPDAHVGLIVGSHVLGIDRVLVIAHTRCAMASGDDAAVVAKVLEADGTDLSGMRIGSSPDQLAALRFDVELLRRDALVDAEVGGFRYDVATGRLEHLL